MLYDIEYTKHFVSGILEGASVTNTLKNCDRNMLKRMVRNESTGKVYIPCAGTSRYTISRVHVVKSTPTPLPTHQY